MIMKLVGLSTGTGHCMTDQYVQSYDPEYHLPDGSYDGGALICTRDPAKAADFDTVESALLVWRAGPTCKCHRTRADGKPNRPLTAFNILVVPREGATKIGGIHGQAIVRGD